MRVFQLFTYYCELWIGVRRRSKVGSLATQLRHGLTGSAKDTTKSSVLDFDDFNSSQTAAVAGHVKMTVGTASDHQHDTDDNDNENDNDDGGCRGRQSSSSAAVDICSSAAEAAPVHSS